MTTDEELRRLEEDRLAPGTLVWVTHFFSHFGSSYEQQAAFQDELRANGFGTPGPFREIGADEELTGDGYWHHWAFTALKASPVQLRRADETAQSIASAHGVRYDGWHVERHRVTGMPVTA
jgi:hypothetical protein